MCEITVQGQKIPATELGSGCYATAYLVEENQVYLFVKKSDYTREEMIKLKGKHFPPIEKVEETEDTNVFAMPYYPDQRDHDKIRKFYDEYQRIYEATRKATTFSIYDNEEKRKIVIQYMIHKVNSMRVPKSVKDSFKELLQLALTWERTPFFDFATFNLSLDEKENIIFRDPFSPATR
jgi:hypothetical protein